MNLVFSDGSPARKVPEWKTPCEIRAKGPEQNLCPKALALKLRIERSTFRKETKRPRRADS